jgi:type VI secretion system protein VasG
MADVNLRSLIAHCNESCHKALEAAAGLTLARTHYNVEIEHLLLALLDRPGSDIPAILRYCDIDAGRVAAELSRALDGLRRGNARAPAMSPDIVDLLKQAWLLTSLEYAAARIRSGHLLLALLSDDGLARHLRDASPLLGAIGAERLARELDAATAASTEVATVTPAPSDAPGQTPAGPATLSSDSALGQFTIDLTARAREGRIDPILGRDGEIRQAIYILTRRRQNNPILTGRRRQNRGGRGSRIAHRRRRRAARFGQRRSAHPRSRPPASRCRHQGRIREPPEIGDR